MRGGIKTLVSPKMHKKTYLVANMMKISRPNSLILGKISFYLPYYQHFVCLAFVFSDNFFLSLAGPQSRRIRWSLYLQL
jgi:hypothetical protein